MKEVTQQEFFDVIGPIDITVSIDSGHAFPYTQLFKLRDGHIIGKAINSYTDDIQYKYPIITKYYLLNESR